MMTGIDLTKVTTEWTRAMLAMAEKLATTAIGAELKMYGDDIAMLRAELARRGGR